MIGDRLNSKIILASKILLFLAFLAFLLTSCNQPQPTQESLISIRIIADGKQERAEVLAGVTVQGILDRFNITLNNLDKVTPHPSTPVTASIDIVVVRVRESFEIQEKVIPFEQQVVRNESMPEGQTLLIQPGVNGVQQITHRKVFEDSKEVSNTIFKTAVLTEPRPEIVMVGVQKPFTPVNLPGKLVYLAGGNAWLMERSSGNRKPVVTTGDLDGRVFSLSDNGEWLLFTRKGGGESKDTINSLWMVQTDQEGAKPISLRVNNIIHFAAWQPGSQLTITFSTVEPRLTAPGWQANNDLHRISYAPSGMMLKREKIIESNSGGVYGWWGTNFAWSPDGKQLAYSRPDGIGLVDLEKAQFQPLVSLLPYQARGDWAWVSGIGWSPKSNVLYFSNHLTKAGLVSEETSPIFDMSAFVLKSGPMLQLAPLTGMFAYPAPSPLYSNNRFLVAYLQSLQPEQSETSKYRIVIMDRDGSNRRTIFPLEGSQGVEPQKLVWAPVRSPDTNSLWLAFLFQGNLWLYQQGQNISTQITGDGLITKIDWK